MHLIGIFTPAMTTWDWIKDKWSYINKTMWSCHATSSPTCFFFFSGDYKCTASVGCLRLDAHSSSAASATLDLIVKTLLQLCSVGEEIASFFKTHGDKEEVGCVFFAGYCCLCFCPIGWMAITADFLCSTERWPLWRCPGPVVSRGKRRELSKLTRLPIPLGSSPPAAAPRGLCCTLLLISSISSVEGPWEHAGPFSHLCYPLYLWSLAASVSLWLERVR